MNNLLTFRDRGEFRTWLAENGTTSEGVWLLFGKKVVPQHFLLMMHWRKRCATAGLMDR